MEMFRFQVYKNSTLALLSWTPLQLRPRLPNPLQRHPVSFTGKIYFWVVTSTFEIFLFLASSWTPKTNQLFMTCFSPFPDYLLAFHLKFFVTLKFALIWVFGTENLLVGLLSAAICIYLVKTLWSLLFLFIFVVVLTHWLLTKNSLTPFQV